MIAVGESRRGGSSSVCSTGGLNHAGSATGGAAGAGMYDGQLLAPVGARGRPLDQRDEHPRPDHHAAIATASRSAIAAPRPQPRGTAPRAGAGAPADGDAPAPRAPRPTRSCRRASASGRRPRGKRRRRAEPPHLGLQRLDLLLEPASSAPATSSAAGGSLTRAAPRARPSPPCASCAFAWTRARRSSSVSAAPSVSLPCSASAPPSSPRVSASFCRSASAGSSLGAARGGARRVDRADAAREHAARARRCRRAPPSSRRACARAPSYPAPLLPFARLPATPRVAVPGRRTTRRGRLRPKEGDREHVTEYEILLLLDPDLADEQQAEVVERLRDADREGRRDVRPPRRVGPAQARLPDRRRRTTGSTTS